MIFKLPAYIRKKSTNRFNSLSICKNISKNNYNAMKAKDLDLNKELELDNITSHNQKEKDKFEKTYPNTNKKIIKDDSVHEKIKIEDNPINVNARFKEIVKNPTPISKDDVQKIKILGDGNCLYRCLSLFLLGNDQFYDNIKEEIIKWIDNNRAQFNEFFGDDDIKNISKEHLAEEEYNYIKKKDSWGGFHTIEIACIIFKLSIGIFTDNGNNQYNRYSYSENQDPKADLMLLAYHNNNHFDLLYDKNLKLNFKEKEIKDLNINLNSQYTKKNIKYLGNTFSNRYVITKYKGREYIYDEISNFLKSIEKHEVEINLEIKNHPHWHINQIYSLFKLEYPKRMEGKEENNSDKRRRFRKEAENYKLDHNNRLTILNPLNKENEKDIAYKIPYLHEKENLVKQIHFNNNHPGRITLINLLHKEKWYWSGMNRDIGNIIKSCAVCNKPFKFKSLSKKMKIIIDNGPHYRYVADLWYLNGDLKEDTGYSYILDIIDHFSKWYNGYLLKTKNADEVLTKIEMFIENFGSCKILQVDNGTEFKNKLLETYCNNNNIKLVHSSPYHPQTNGVVEVVHKEIKKYIYSEYFKNKENFDIEIKLFNITKIHNNKVHSTTKRIPREIRDIDDVKEIEEINQEITNTLLKKNKNFDILDPNKSYVIDYNKIYINNDRILKKKGKLKKQKKQIKIPIAIISEYNSENSEFFIEIKKEYNNLKEGKSFIVSLDLLEEVNNDLWLELLK